MMRLHPDLDALLALRDGERAPPDIERHVQACPACRRRLLEARVLRILVKASAEQSVAAGATPPLEPGEHLDEITLAAYHDQTLPLAGIARVERHLLGCDRCLQDLLTLRADLEDVDSEAVPAPAFHSAVRTLLAGQTRKPSLLGGLALLLRGGRLDPRYLPVPAADDSSAAAAELRHEGWRQLQALWQAATEGPEASGYDGVAPALEMALEAELLPQDLGPGEQGLQAFQAAIEEALVETGLPVEGSDLDWPGILDAGNEWPLPAPSLGTGGTAAPTTRASEPPSPAAEAAVSGASSWETIQTEVGTLHLALFPEPEPPTARLRVRVTDRITGAPEPGQRLRLTGPGPDAVTTQTDEQGEALFLLPAGLAHLSLEAVPEAELLVLVVPDAEGV